MSYCRFSNADVYVYCDVGGYLCCCACSLRDDWKHYSTDAMIAHLREHIAAGHDVPDYVIAELEADREENDAFFRSGSDLSHLRSSLELLSDAAMLPAGDSPGDAPTGLRRDEEASDE